MTNQQIRSFFKEYFSIFDKGNVTQQELDHYISERDQELKDHIQVFQGGIPGYQLIPQDIIVEGNKAVIRMTVSGRHTGTLMGFPPTGNNVNVEVIVIYELEGGKIVNHWMQADMPSLMEQISQVAVRQRANL